MKISRESLIYCIAIYTRLMVIAIHYIVNTRYTPQLPDSLPLVGWLGALF